MPRPTLAGIRAAAARLRPYLEPTPLLRCDVLSRALDAEVWLKNETVTPIASFKIRGAMNGTAAAAEAGASGTVTSSTGNHGQGVAYAARLLGLRADIFLPTPANPVKAAMIEAFGGALHEVGSDIDEAKEAARSFAREHGRAFLDDGEDVAIMEGAGTIGLEVAEALPDIDAMIVPMGGGNLASGCATALEALQPEARVYSVQSDESSAVTESYHAREALERRITTLADGLATRVPPRLALSVLWDLLDDAWLVSDEALLAATHALIECAHVLVEPSGAAALAGAVHHRDELAGRRVVLLLTGANISTGLLRRALDTAPLVSL